MATTDSAREVVRGAWNPWPHRLALVTTAATFLLILAGGVVTNTGTGMAVPDWPTTFGHNMFLYPWSKMVGGILYEHAHRLIGSLVGALTLTLAIFLWALEPRPWVRGLGIAALGAVVVQGVLGGLRVVLAQDGLAIVHGGFAHAFFALIAGLTLVTSPSWRAAVPSRVASPARSGCGGWRVSTTAGLYVQMLLGTLVTHLGARLDAHLFVAALISVAVILLGFWILPGRADWPELVRPAEILRVLWIVQLLLGLGAYRREVPRRRISRWGRDSRWRCPVSHRLTGGLMLIASLVLTLRIYRRTGWLGSEAGRRALLPEGVGMTLRALASPGRASAPSGERWTSWLLTKPRVVLMVLVTTFVGFHVGSLGPSDPLRLLHALVGTWLAAAGASALNQYLERDVDGRMERTRRRPLPDKRLQPREAGWFGLGLTLAGPLYLGLAVNWLSAAVVAVTAASYLLAYTPLKRRSSLCTVLGAIPGALPPVAGWVAARGEFGVGAWILFGILFLWQLPHTLAIAWVYRTDYARADLRMLPVVDPDGGSTGRQVVVNCLALLAVGMLPTLVGMAGPVYFLGALLLGVVMLACGLGLAVTRSVG